MATDAMNYQNPYAFTAAGELGINRETMLQNELLLRTELGKPKRRGVIVPAGLTYGRPNALRDGGSTEALHGWPTLSSTTLPFKQKEKTAQRDFMALNRAAVSADKPSTPIFDLLEHKYQDKWLQERRKLELAKRQEESKMGRSTHSAGILGSLQKRSPGQVYETRASLLRTYQNPVDADPLWQMPRFTKEAKPSLQTFRSAQARRSAYDNFDSDKISRKGNFGHGTYESAKN
ncbi:cilia- and flagella-associated protein 77-like [Mercenaria mercenaria]|uniref:cilia- and flagella-associated protein 77-like n=1 Tax=Mercenaria mercenaria TaxID=6596 RepID=UPI00234E40E3|nr:cilia- and flagella-associated protein 77-like [Mercenaria mercenaria]